MDLRSINAGAKKGQQPATGKNYLAKTVFHPDPLYAIVIEIHLTFSESDFRYIVRVGSRQANQSLLGPHSQCGVIVPPSTI